MLGQIMIRSAPPNCQSCAAALAAAMTETNYDWEQPADHGHPQDRTTNPQNSSNSLRCRMFIYDHLPNFSRFEGFTYTQRSSSAGFSPFGKYESQLDHHSRYEENELEVWNHQPVPELVEAKLTGTPNISLVGIIVYGAVMAGPSPRYLRRFETCRLLEFPKCSHFFREFPKS